MRVIYASYADGSFVYYQTQHCHLAGYWPDTSIQKWTEAQFLSEHSFLSGERGLKRPYGYCWKPWLLLRSLQRASNNTVVIYQDAGRGLKYLPWLYPREMISLTLEHSAIVGVEGDYMPYLKSAIRTGLKNKIGDVDINKRVVQASLSMWTPKSNIIDFVRNWYDLCVEDAREVAESSVDPTDVRTHSWDQVHLSILNQKADLFTMKSGLSEKNISKSLSYMEMTRRPEFSMKLGAVGLRCINIAKHKLQRRELSY